MTEMKNIAVEIDSIPKKILEAAKGGINIKRMYDKSYPNIQDVLGKVK